MVAMLDLLIRDGEIVDTQGIMRGSLGVAGGRIAARFATGAELPPAREVIDAGDLVVAPGIVDPHVHFYGEGIGEYSRLAVMGGVTTFIGMIRGAPDESLESVTSRHVTDGRRDAVADYSFHVVLHERDDVPAQIAAAAARGFRSFKMFLAYKRRGMMVSERFLQTAMHEIRKIGGTALVHAEDGEFVDALEQQAIAAGRRKPEHYAPTRPPEAEAAAIEMVALAAQLTGCRAYIVHVSSQAGLAAVERARARGVPLWAETCPQYLLMNDDTLRRHGPLARIAPPLRQPTDQTALATALATGAINTVGSDHASYAFAAKDEGRDDIFAAPFGMPGAPIHWPSMFTWALDHGVALPVLVRAMTETPARIFGLAHRKGTLLPGADADIMLFDAKTRRCVDAAKAWPKVCPNPLADTAFAGWPQVTICRGVVVWRESEVQAAPGFGTLVEQQVHAPVSATEARA
jgi:dihydroorotase-like cyclic amidohydrolase